MYSTNYHTNDLYYGDDIFSGDVGVVARFIVGGGEDLQHVDLEHLDLEPPLYFPPPPVLRAPRRDTIPRKPVPFYEQVPMSHDSYISTGSDADMITRLEKQASVQVEEEAVQKRGWQFYGTFACLAILNLICAIDATILSVALPIIATDLNASAIQAFWCGTAFLLCSTVFQPTWASFSHIIGRKSVLLSALFFFFVGTILASVATSISVLLVGRCVQGVGGGGLVGLTYVILADMVSLRDRGKWQSIISLQWAIGSVMGPVVGGLFAEKATWRWIFWLNIPFCVIATIGIPICLQLHPREGSVLERLKTFDVLGSFVFIASATSVLIPITWGGIMYDWSSWRTLVPLILGVAGLLAFVIYSAYISPSPLIHRDLFNSSTAITAYCATLVHGIMVWSLLYYMPLYFEVAKDYSPVTSGVAIFPFTFTVAPAAIGVGIVIAKTGRYRPSIWTGWFLTTFGMGLLIYLKSSTSVPSWIFLSLVPGIGTGMLFSAQGFAAQASVTPANIPFAGALYSFFRAAGQTLGVAMSGVIFQNTFKNRILSTPYFASASLWSRDASAFVQVVKSWPKIEADGSVNVMRETVVEAYVESLRMVWIIMCVLAGITFIASVIWIEEKELLGEVKTEQGFRYEGKGKGVEDEKGGVSTGEETA